MSRLQQLVTMSGRNLNDLVDPIVRVFGLHPYLFNIANREKIRTPRNRYYLQDIRSTGLIKTISTESAVHWEERKEDEYDDLGIRPKKKGEGKRAKKAAAAAAKGTKKK
eukprot:TRINITY_DN8527_c0_g1_i1.p1 TRINITY_DN8527_c0_g1~~TRINITY_DN8527_c0_g1_i1.p1  ORF type:complete len:109 (+),score=20.41 TRINITY_DN8527_c0_g1_i1:70-396(+)